MYIEWYIQTVQQITRTLRHKNQFTSLCCGQKPASKCIRLVYEILVRCRALQALYTPQRCELMKTKTNNINCSYRIFIVCRSPVSPVFWARILLTNFCLSRVRVHRFRDNAVTGDIPLISPVLEWMVPLSTCFDYVRNFWDILRQLSDRFSSSPPLLGFYWNRWGEIALPQASMPTIYKQHLYSMTPYTLKYGPGLGKTLFPVLGDNRTLRMRQPDH